MRNVIRILVAAALIAAAVLLAPRLLHTCGNCDTFFVGTGYSANVVSDFITGLGGREDKVLCRDCAAQEHALALAAGMTLDEFRIPLFETGE